VTPNGDVNPPEGAAEPAAGGSQAMASRTGAQRAKGEDAHHWRRLIIIWVVASVALDLLFYLLVGPHVPPGRMSSTAGGAVFDFNVLFVIALPVMLAVWIYMAYAIIEWRASRGGPEPVGGAAARTNLPIQTTWIAVTTVLVLFLAGFGTYQLVQPEGSGGGQGPSPIWTPTSNTVLPIQVIGQQWKWTYRYPTFGGFETTQLVIPNNTSIAFHVTSLDVIHSFWAYQLGVKADANPGQDNVAFTTAYQTGTFIVRCSELCGIWHGAMYNTGTVVTPAQFEVWAKSTEQLLAANTKLLPPFAWSYTPDANGADGGYYPDNVDPYSPVETYGAKQPGQPLPSTSS
jgi:cytochrome c oxidase subunit 2